MRRDFQLVEAGQKVLERDDLTQQQREEIAETLSTRAVNFEAEVEIDVMRKP